MAADAMIQTLTAKLFDSLVSQAQFALDFNDELGTMNTKLEIMKAFLSSTDNLESHRHFLPNLRNLIYEADDILTDCLIRDEYLEDRSCWKYSPQELLFSFKTAQKLKQINSKIENLEKIISALRQRQPISQGKFSNQCIGYPSQDYDPSEIIGLEKDMEKIKKWLLSSNEEFNRVGIVGMGGLGKTTCAQKIFNDKQVGLRFKKRIWLSVSQNFSADRIMRSMLKDLGEDHSALGECDLLRKIHQRLGDETCLIVMDDVWRMNTDWWNKLCPPNKRIFAIITSRDEDVTKSMGVDISRIHRPKTLNKEESWLLFSKLAFATNRGNCPSRQFESVGRGILEKCGGLPLAIKTIGALLAPKIHSLIEWQNIKDYFHEMTTEGKNTDVIMASLQLSYDYLPSLLKQCFLCFSIYPEDFEISGEHIVHWWIGEGLIQGQSAKTATELGFQYLSELVSRCLVEVVRRRGYDGRVYCCKVHDMVREMTIKIAKGEAFCNFTEQGRQILSKDSRWLGFTSDITEPLKKSPKLRALLLMPSMPVSIDRNLKLLMSLRVLNLSGVKFHNTEIEDVLNFICSLKRLSSLNMSEVAGLKELPSSIQMLHNLQILVLRECKSLAKIHPSITNLKKLIVLDVGLCAFKFLPCGLEKLVHLQELSGFQVGSQTNKHCCRLVELVKLMQLRVLQITINSDCDISQEEGNVLSQLENLKVLSIDADECTDTRVAEMLDRLSPPPGLQEFHLRGYRHQSLPKWFNPRQLSKLHYLSLEDGGITYFETSPESDNGTWNLLEGLRLKSMQNLDLDWQKLENDIPLLHYAEISRCYSLKNFPHPTDTSFIWRREQE